MLTDLPDLILVYIAIISHKAVAAFALGTSMLKAELPSFRYGVLACIFIFATPLGMLIAVIVLEFLASSEGSTATVTLVTEVSLFFKFKFLFLFLFLSFVFFFFFFFFFLFFSFFFFFPPSSRYLFC